VRLNRFLALAGLGARRKCETLIREGRIEVNGETVDSLGVQVDPERDRVECDGERLRPPRVLLYSVMFKPSGFTVTASDERGRPTVYELLPERLQGKLRAVGRLDQGSEGLLLFTNDGEFANALLHPRSQVARTYVAWVTPPPDREAMHRLRTGVPLGRGERSAPADARVMGSKAGTARVRLTIREGKNREVRRMFKAVGHRVLALRRIEFGGLGLGTLKPGQVRALLPAEIAALRKAAGIARED
jgi:23S rRNA pseudouridine2605 synthase